MPDILLITTWPPAACGIATYAQYLANAHRKAGHRVTVFGETLDSEQPRMDVEHGVIRSWNRRWAYEAKYGLGSLCKLIKSSPKPPDLVHIQHEFGLFPDSIGFIRFLKELLGAGLKVAVTFHTVPEPPTAELFFKELPQGAVYFVHSGEAASVLACCGVTPTVVPHGTTPDLTKTTSEHFLTFGFISPSKGLETLIHGYAQACASVDGAAVPAFHMVGLCRDDRYFDNLKELIRSLYLENRVRLENRFVPDAEAHALVRQAMAVVLGHKHKIRLFSASGQLALALGAGKPVIAHDSPIYNRPGGILRFTTVEECARQMRAVASQPSLRDTLSHASQGEALRTDWSCVVNAQIERLVKIVVPTL